MHRHDRSDWTEVYETWQPDGRQQKREQPPAGLPTPIVALLEDSLGGHMMAHLMANYNLDWDLDQLPDSTWVLPLSPEHFSIVQVLRTAFIQHPQLELPIQDYYLNGSLMTVLVGLNQAYLTYKWTLTNKED